MYGRSIYENIRKFLQFQLTVNFSACILVFLCSCIGNDTPLTSIQMLWVNLIMDSLGSLALATEPPYEELLNRKPTDKNESIINGRMWKHISFQSLFEITILIIIYLLAPKFIPEDKQAIKDSAENLEKCFGILPGKTDKSNIIYGVSSKWEEDGTQNFDIFREGCNSTCPDIEEGIRNGWQGETMYEFYNHYINYYGGTTHMTLIFDIFVCYTLFNQINCRIIDDSFNTFKRISKGVMFCIVTLCELAIQIVLSQIGNQVFHCVSGGLSFTQWMICLGFSISTMVFNFFIKLIPLEKLIDKNLPKEEKNDKNEKVEKIEVEGNTNSDNIIEIK
jgi:magnesium-transporting ATPase (P-type)